MDHKDHFSNWLKRTMSNKGVNGRWLAEQTGVTDSAVSRWLNGSQLPRVELLSKIASALGVEPLRLYVTAGRISARDAGVDPLPIPPPCSDRGEYARFVIDHIPGLSRNSIRRLMEAYDQVIKEESQR